MDPAVTQAWEHAVADWGDARRHDELLTAVAKHGAYAWAARQYQQRLKETPDDTITPRQLERLRKSAELTLYASAAVRPDKQATPYKATIATFLVLVFALVAALLVTSILRGKHVAKQGLPAASQGSQQR